MMNGQSTWLYIMFMMTMMMMMATTTISFTINDADDAMIDDPFIMIMDQPFLEQNRLKSMYLQDGNDDYGNEGKSCIESFFSIDNYIH